MARSVFLRNAPDGLPAQVLQHLEKQRRRHPGIEIEPWGELELRKLENRFDLAAIDEWSWSEEDFDILVEDYLKPTRQQIRLRLREAYDERLPTVEYGADYE